MLKYRMTCEPYLDVGNIKWGRTHLFFWGGYLGLCSVLPAFQNFCALREYFKNAQVENKSSS